MNLQGQKGFTLLETLATVGIFGILIGISVPSYKNYIRHSKTAEAQSSLGQIYMAEKAFFLQWRFYTGDLLVAGVAPEGEMLYNVGFSSTDTGVDYNGSPIQANRDDFFDLCRKEFGTGSDAGMVKNCAFKNKYNTSGFDPPAIPVQVDVDGDPKVDNGTMVNTTATNDTFTAAAIADIINQNPKNDPTETHDIWSIDNYKQVVRVKDGTRKE